MDEILSIEHSDWESVLSVGDIEFRTSRDGPFPNHQMRVSASPSAGYAALNYMDHDDPEHPVVNSFNPRRPLPDVFLIFNGAIGSIFPRTAAVPIADARRALAEWLKTRTRPTCIEWRPYDIY
ncbi:Imm1 family immunity protein [Kutzneria sp. NPDC051319]|uniref:Imm1 family immunity protein n=1 Tax=Kutzneria sp. NPDC051319 TaxID=3155047 RepID=UPI00341DEDB0